MSLKSSFSDLIQALTDQWPTVTLGGLLCAVFCHNVVQYIKKAKFQRKILERGERSRKSLEKLRQQFRQEQVDTRITEMPFQELQEALQDGNLKAVDVLNAYMAKALEVNEMTNAITDYITTAKAEAEALDRIPASERGLLHGIPISVKESCGLKGEDCTAGIGALIDVPMANDSVMIQVMKSHGAVPFIRTNLPQAMRSFATDNPIYGLTSNPLDNSRSPGGSSGGEGAIIGGGGSILGLGSDIGGSCRIPAAFCGISTLKPTAGRLSYVGNFGTGTRLGGQSLVLGSEGPMGRGVYSLVQYMRAAMCPKLFSMDPTVPPIPFQDDLFQGKTPLRIGVYTYDGCTRCVPSVIRAVNVAKETLQSLGHTLVEFEPHDVKYGIDEVMWPAVFGDDCQAYAKLIKYDDTCDILADLVKLHQRPAFQRWILAKWNSLVYDDPMTEGMIARKPTKTTRDWWNTSINGRVFQGRFLSQWKKQKVDLVICPVMPSVATKHGLDRKLLSAISYTAIYNVVNYPAGTLPVTHVTADDVIKTRDPSFYSAKTHIERRLKEDSTTTEGLPVGIQVVGLPYKEELVLRVMTELEQALAS